MNAEPILRPTTERFAAKAYAAFRIDPELPGRAYQIRFYDKAPTTLEEAVNDAKTNCYHKTQLVIRETDALTGEARLHLYVIRKKAPIHVRRGMEVVRVQEMYADPVCILPAACWTEEATAERLRDVHERIMPLASRR